MRILNRLSARSTLLIDAVVSGATGLLLVTAAGPLGDLLDLPTSVLRVSGAIMIPYAALLGAIATRSAISKIAMEVVIAGNLLWTAASVILVVGDWVEPNALGFALVIVQAIVVGGLALVQIAKATEVAGNRSLTTLTHV